MKTIRRIVILGALAALVITVLTLVGVLAVSNGDDGITRLIAAVSGFLVVGGTALEARDASRSWQMPEPEDPPGSANVMPLEKATHKIEQAEDFSQRAADKVRIRIDVEDAHDD